MFYFGDDEVVKRIIFDLDETLIPWDKQWDIAVKETLDEFGIDYDFKSLEDYQKAIVKYETEEKRYSIDRLVSFFSDYLGIQLSSEFFNRWIDKLSVLVPEKDEKLISMLSRLSKKYSLVVATNWFKRQQVSKLKLCGLLDFFDEVITGEDFDIKPSTQMFNYYKQGYDDSEVVMVGDKYESDIKGANDAGLHGYLITTDSKYTSNDNDTVIKNIYELEKYL